MASLFAATSQPSEAPRSTTTAGLAAGRSPPRSRATRRLTYSASDIPRSLARWRARRCISRSSMICVRAIMMSPCRYQASLMPGTRSKWRRFRVVIASSPGFPGFGSTERQLPSLSWIPSARERSESHSSGHPEFRGSAPGLSATTVENPFSPLLAANSRMRARCSGFISMVVRIIRFGLAPPLPVLPSIPLESPLSNPCRCANSRRREPR